MCIVYLISSTTDLEIFSSQTNSETSSVTDDNVTMKQFSPAKDEINDKLIDGEHLKGLFINLLNKSD